MVEVYYTLTPSDFDIAVKVTRGQRFIHVLDLLSVISRTDSQQPLKFPRHTREYRTDRATTSSGIGSVVMQ